MATLAEQLEERKKASAANTPEATKAVMGRSLRLLGDSGIADGALAVGDKAPDFALPDATGSEVSLSGVLAGGPAVLSFYRGAWCPYCNLELRALQASLEGFQGAGGTLVAISPNTPDTSMSVVERHQLEFPVLSDLGNEVARKFGLVFEVPADLEAVYRDMGHDIGTANGAKIWEIPIPATYVVAPDLAITYAFVDSDYRNRAEPADVIAALAAD